MILEGFFNLEKNPFLIHPNVEFYCQLKPHEEALNMILYALSNQDGLIKVTGNIGLGKSIVASCLREKLVEQKQYHVCEIRNPNLTTIELLQSILRQLTEKSKSVDSAKTVSSELLLSNLEQHLIKYRDRNKRVVLIIDEAQAMEDSLLETLRLLTNLEHNSKPLIQMVLFGQDELDIKLNQHKFRQLKQRICFAYKVRPLNESEVSTYVQHRLFIAGSKHRPIFSESSLQLLAKYTNGIPRNINIIAHKAMLFAASANTYQVSNTNVIDALKEHSLYSWLMVDWKKLTIAALCVVNITIVLAYLIHLITS